jgi:hypothetical protein
MTTTTLFQSISSGAPTHIFVRFKNTSPDSPKPQPNQAFIAETIAGLERVFINAGISLTKTGIEITEKIAIPILPSAQKESSAANAGWQSFTEVFLIVPEEDFARAAEIARAYRRPGVVSPSVQSTPSTSPSPC